jgi:hypothetical protein
LCLLLYLSNLPNLKLIQVSNGFSSDSILQMASKNDLFVSKPYVDLNSTKTLSMAVVGDIDYNLGLTAQLDMTKEYNVQTLIILGDYVYASGSKVLSILESHGFTKGNTDN